MFKQIKLWSCAGVFLLCSTAYALEGQVGKAVMLQNTDSQEVLPPVQALIQGKYWNIDTLINDTRNDVYKMRQIPPEEAEVPQQGKFVYGGFLKLSENGAFQSYYTAPCGNDCFPNYEGLFEVVDDHHIRFHLTHASQDGDCESFNRDEDLDLGTFLLQPSEDGFYLIRSQSTKTDAQQLQYWEKTKQSLTTMTQKELDERLRNISIEYRKRSHEEILQEGIRLDGRFKPEEAKLLFVSTNSGFVYILYLFEINGQLKVGAYHYGTSKFAVVDL